MLLRYQHTGDRVALDIAMSVVPLYNHPAVGATLTRGPLVYCLEEHDNGSFLNGPILQQGGRFRCEPAEDLAGAVDLVGEAMQESGSESGGLYRVALPRRSSVTVRGIPYYAWDIPGAGEMLVWIREER